MPLLLLLLLELLLLGLRLVVVLVLVQLQFLQSGRGGGRTYKVERAELGGGLVQAGVGREDRAATLTLVADDTTHCDGCMRLRLVVREVGCQWY